MDTPEREATEEAEEWEASRKEAKGEGDESSQLALSGCSTPDSHHHNPEQEQEQEDMEVEEVEVLPTTPTNQRTSDSVVTAAAIEPMPKATVRAAPFPV
jgi:hypothetical protein